MNQSCTVKVRKYLNCWVGAWAAISISLFSPLPGHAQINITSDWTTPISPAPAHMYGVNVWSGTTESIATNPAYVQCLTNMNLGFLRYHSAVTMSGSSGDSASTWIDPVNKVWLTNRIKNILTATKGCAPDKIMNIANFPPWMVDSNGKLTAAYQGTGTGSYAQFCAALVQIADNNGTYIKYWEPTNELNGLYSGDMTTLSSIFLNCRNAMKTVDSSILVGGPAFSNPWDTANYTAFFAAVAGQIDFITYHDYSEFSPQPISTLYSDATGNAASYVSQLAFNAGINVPIFCDEWNMYGSYNNDTSGQMASPQSAVYDALRFKAFIEGGNLAGATSFNDADNTYGKINPSYSSIRPSGTLNALANQFLTGCWCQTSSTNAGAVAALATRNGTQRSLMLICQSTSAQTVSLNFLGVDVPSFPLTAYTISSSSGYSTSTINYNGTAPSLSLAPNSVEILVFNDDVTTGPTFANASFETPLTTAWPYYLPNYMTPASINSASLWAFTGNAGIQRNGSGFGASALVGTQTAFLGSSSGVGGTISQSVNFTAPGEYRISFLAARCNGGIEPIQVSVGGTNVGVPLTPLDNTFRPCSVIFSIPSAGTYVCTLTATDLSNQYTTLIDDVKIDQYQNGTPYGGTPMAIPGLIQADNFNLGGEGVAYHDTYIPNDGGAYRTSEGVDIYPTTDTGNGYYVGNINPGEWMKYAVNVTGGNYNINIRASSYWGGGPVVLLLDGVPIGQVTIPQTWGTTNFTTVVIPNVHLAAGNNRTLTVQAPNAGFNLNWISFTNVAVANGTYKIINRNSGLALQPSASSTTAGTSIVQWTYSGITAQQWNFQVQADGSYVITNVNSGMVMDIYGASTANGASDVQWPANGGPNQKWQLQSIGGGYYTMTNENSGQLLDMYAGETWNGVSAIQWSANGGYNQMWQIAAP